MEYSTFSDGGVKIGGVDYSKKYPGYEFRSLNSDQIILVEKNGKKEIIEVLGESYPVPGEDVKILDNGSAIMTVTQDVVAVLEDEDAQLYWKLQWLDYWRWHGDIKIVKLFQYAIAGLILFLAQFIAGIFFIATGSSFWEVLPAVGLSFFCSPILVAIELIAFAYCFPFVQMVLGFFNVIFHILTGKIKRKKSLIYYKKIFQSLSTAYCKDKARSAKIMNKALFFVSE